MLGQEAGIYRALEFGGSGLTGLSLESRMVLPNMMAESGAKNAYLTPDELVFEWLARRRAARSGQPLEECLIQVASGALYPDADAEYIARSSASSVHTCKRRAAGGSTCSAAFIGTCTNGRLEDLAGQRRLGNQVAGRTRLLVPASSEC
jgi:3-isopropylmalate/(R)-2-methylmalate dehydratase large subunit